MSDVDLVVAGAGGGLCAALRAAQLGRDVLVVDANEHFSRGNNTAMSTAMVPGAGTRFQRAAGVTDSPETLLEDIGAKTGGTAEPTIARALAEISAELVEWLADYVGVPIELPTDFAYPGHSVPRVHSLPGRHGARLLRYLLDAANASPNIDLLAPARLVDVRPHEAGHTVLIERPGGATETVEADAVLLATNGYAADPSAVAEHLPEIAAATYHGSEYSTGDALRIGRGLGAATGYLDAYQGHAALSSKARTLVTWTTVMHGAVLVDSEGRRFGDETTGYSEYAAMLAARPGAAGWLVYDERIHRGALRFDDYRDVLESGAVLSADSTADLAAAISVTPAALAAEIEELGEVACGTRAADRFGRTGFSEPLRAPYRAVRVVPALFHSQGGLAVDADARVRSRDGGSIPGLYASGGAAAGISGHGAAGYLAGNGLLPALGLAYLAASHFACGDRSETTLGARR